MDDGWMGGWTDGWVGGVVFMVPNGAVWMGGSNR